MRMSPVWYTAISVLRSRRSTQRASRLKSRQKDTWQVCSSTNSITLTASCSMTGSMKICRWSPKSAHGRLNSELPDEKKDAAGSHELVASLFEWYIPFIQFFFEYFERLFIKQFRIMVMSLLMYIPIIRRVFIDEIHDDDIGVHIEFEPDHAAVLPFPLQKDCLEDTLFFHIPSLHFPLL